MPTFPQPVRLSIDELLLKLDKVKPSPNGWQACCPAHEDTTPSLGISEARNGGILLNCRAGCTFADICRALNVLPSQFGPPKPEPLARQQLIAAYDYTDAQGVLLYQVVRYSQGGKKVFKQRKPDGKGNWIWSVAGVPRVPYQLPKLVGKDTVYVVEGEKDCITLTNRGLPATTNSGGAGKWGDAETQSLKNLGVKRIIIVPDNDAPGRKHADDVARYAKVNDISFTIVSLPGLREHGDITDWFAQGHQLAELHELASKPYIVQSGTADLPTTNHDLQELALIQSRMAAGQAQLFSEKYGAEFCFNHFRQTWMHYEAPCWRLDADKAIWRAALQFTRDQQYAALAMPAGPERKDAMMFSISAEKPAAMKNMIEAATWNNTFGDVGKNWDADPWLLAVDNGVIDLKTGILREGRPQDRITMKCSVPYRPDAQCPRWWQFLAEVFSADEAVVEFVWRLCGYILTGQTTERIVPMFYGRGANGKSVFLNVFSTILGDYAFTLPFSTMQFQKQESIPNDLAALVGRRFVTMIEANDGLRLNEAKLKTLSGNDKISARFLHGEFFEFQPVAKFVLAMNHKPIAKDDSPGFWDRIRLVPFLNTFPSGQRDEGLQARLIEQEGAGILAWAVQGCLRWQQSGLTKPEAVMSATADYQADSDQLGEFLTACSEADPESLTGAGEVQKAYNSWSEGRGFSRFERLSATALGRLLGERFERKRTTKGLFYIGLRLISTSLW